MRTAWETFPIECRGGLITNQGPLMQGVNFPGSAIELTNYEPSIEGGYAKIKGYTKWIEDPVPGEGQIRGAVVTGLSSAIAVRGGKYYTSTDKEPWVERLDLSEELGGKIRWARFNFDGTPKVVMVDGRHKPVFWDSSDNSIEEDTSANADTEGATRVAVFKNHLFFANGSKIVFTQPFDETGYDPAQGSGVINVGDRIVGLTVFREQLIIFSFRSIHRLVGNTSSDFQLQPIAENTGALCGDTIQEVGGDILYLGPDGVRFLSATERIGDFALQRASEQIQTKVTNLFTDCENFASVVLRSKSQYRIFRYLNSPQQEARASAQGFIGTKFIDRQAEGMSWAETKGINVYAADSHQIGSIEIVLFVSNTDYVYEMENGPSFDGEPITCIYQTPFFAVNDPQLRKTFYKHSAYIKASGPLHIEASLVLDYGSASPQPSFFSIEQNTTTLTIWGQFLWAEGTWNAAVTSVFPTNLVGSAFTASLRYVETSNDLPYVIDTIVLEYRTNDRK